MQAHRPAQGRLARTACALTLGVALALGFILGTPQTAQAGPTPAQLAQTGELAACSATHDGVLTINTNFYQVVLSCTLTLPEDGLVYMHTSSSLGAGAGGSYEVLLNLNIDATTGNTATDRWVNVYPDASQGSDKTFANSYLAPVSAGAHTFYFLALQRKGPGTPQLLNPSLSVLYFPSSSSEVLACSVTSNHTREIAKSAFQEIRSCTLSVPRSGFVYLSGTSSLALNLLTSSPYEGRFRLGINSVSGAASSERRVNITTDSDDGTDDVVVTSLIAPIDAGDHTFYFSGALASGGGPVVLYDPSLIALYFPAPNVTAKVCGDSGSGTWTTSASTFATIRSCTFYLPKDGFAFVDASASAGLDNPAPGNDWVGHFGIGVDGDSGSPLFERWVNVYPDAGDGTDRSVALSGLVNLNAGSHTLSLLGRRSAGSGTVRLSAPSLSVIVPNIAPAITDVADQTIIANTATAPLPFTVTTSEEPASVAVIGSSSNQALVPDANIVVNGTGSARTVTVTPAPNRSGTVSITLLLDDPTSPVSSTFQLTITPLPVSLTAPADQSVQGAAPIGPLTFSVHNVTSVTATSSDPALVPDANIVIDGTGETRTITVTPVPGRSGTATITITARNDAYTETASFTVTVLPFRTMLPLWMVTH